MIIYICTYPRSGNSFLQQLVQRNLNHIPTQFDADGGPAENWIRNWDFRLAPEALDTWPAGLLWNEFTATYQPKGTSRPEDRVRFLRPVPYHSFSEDMRHALASEPTPFFIKSHWRPYQDYFAGERVIHVTRHPGPTLWSYYRLLNELDVKRSLASTISLDSVIEGRVDFGDWSEYHHDFQKAKQSLGESYLRIDYEELLSDYLGVGARVSNFCSLPFWPRGKQDFELYDQRLAGWGSRGTNEGFEQFYTEDQLNRMWARHAVVARELGYCGPKAAGHNGEQVTRLIRAISTYEIALDESRQRASQAAEKERDERRRRVSAEAKMREAILEARQAKRMQDDAQSRLNHIERRHRAPEFRLARSIRAFRRNSVARLFGR